MKKGPIRAIKLIPIEGIPLIKPGDDLPAIIIKSANSYKINWFEGDILVIAQKIVSKAEGRLVNLKQIKPSKRAFELGLVTQKDPRLVELILHHCQRELLRDMYLVLHQQDGMNLA